MTPLNKELAKFPGLEKQVYAELADSLKGISE
jgi:hypothetical protein